MLAKRIQKVLDSLAFIAAFIDGGDFEELRDDLSLVVGAERGCSEHGRELDVGFEGLGELVEGAAGRVEDGSFGCGGILMVWKVSKLVDIA